MDLASAASAERKILTIGISGVSSSGKTTLGRLLRDIWPNTFILHEDDFYWPDSQIPVKNGIQDWDCIESINLEALHQALMHIRRHGTLPPDFESKEDQNMISHPDVSPETVQSMKDEASLISDKNQSPNIAIVDGFLLYSQNMTHIWDLFDLRLFLRASYENAKKRREARAGYMTIEGYWEDPPGYVDDVVWPNYVHEHKYLFKNEDVHAEFDSDVCQRMGLRTAPPDAQIDMTACLQWANALVKDAVNSNKVR